MNIKELLKNNCLSAHNNASSTKMVLGVIAELLAEHCPSIGTDKVLDSLIARERLGSTGVGHGVAIPHTKVASLAEPVLALVTTTAPIDFGSPDNQGVDIFFALLLPDEDHGEHLEALRCITERVRSASYREGLRDARDNSALLDAAAR